MRIWGRLHQLVKTQRDIGQGVKIERKHNFIHSLYRTVMAISQAPERVVEKTHRE